MIDYRKVIRDVGLQYTERTPRESVRKIYLYAQASDNILNTIIASWLELNLKGSIENYKREREKARKCRSPVHVPDASLLSLGPTYRKERTVINVTNNYCYKFGTL